MKKITLLILSVFFALSGISQEAAKGFELTVKISGYPKGEKLSLGRYYADKEYLLDTAIYDSNRDVYVFKRPERLEGGMHMLISYKNEPAEIIIDQDQHFSIEIVKNEPRFGTEMKFENSPENQIYQDFMKRMEPFFKEVSQSQKDMDSIDPKSPEGEAIIKKGQSAWDSITNAQKKFIQEYPKHLFAAIFRAQKDVEIPEAPADLLDADKAQWRYNYWKEHYFDNIDLATDDRLLRTPIYHSKLEYYIEKVLSPHPDSLKFGLSRVIEKTRGNKELFRYTIITSINKYLNSQIIGYDAIWVYLAKKYYLSGDAFWAAESYLENLRNQVKRYEPLLIGNVPAEFFCPDTNVGKENVKHLSVFSPKNRYTIVVFWEPNCGHCKKFMPALLDFYNKKRKELDFEVFAVCRDSDVARWKQYIYSNNMTHWTNVNGKESNVKYDDLWDVHSTPTVYVLDSQKRIVTKKVEADQLEPFMRNWNALYYPDKK